MEQAAGAIGQRIFRESSTAGTHHPIADRHTLGIGADFGDFARPMDPEHGAGASNTSGRLAGTVLGIEWAGEVAEVGPDAKGVAVGDR